MTIVPGGIFSSTVEPSVEVCLNRRGAVAVTTFACMPTLNRFGAALHVVSVEEPTTGMGSNSQVLRDESHIR